MEEIKWIEHLQRVDLRPGDRLVLAYPFRLSREAHARILETMERWAPGVPVLIVEEGMALGVLGEERVKG